MSDAPTIAPAGLAGLLSALQPRCETVPDAPPDLGAIRQDGWEAGFVAGEAAAEAALVPLSGALAAAAAALAAACRIDVDRLRPVFASLVEQVASAVLMAELNSGALVLVPLVDAALAQVRVGEAAVLRAHPDTLAALSGHLCSVMTEAAPDMAPGEVCVSAPGFVVEAGISARLAEIVAGLV